MSFTKKITKIILGVALAMNIMILPVMATDGVASVSIEPRFNNISAAHLSLSFDTSNVVYCSFELSPFPHCTGFEGIMRLFDSSGTLCKSWAVSDRESPFEIEETYQGVYGETYTLTFQGYAYGEGTMFDDIEGSVTSTNQD